MGGGCKKGKKKPAGMEGKIHLLCQIVNSENPRSVNQRLNFLPLNRVLEAMKEQLK